MDTATQQATGLTKADLKALRNADDAVVRVTRDGATFELLKRRERRDTDGFTSSDSYDLLRYPIAVENHGRAIGTVVLHDGGAFQVLQRFCRVGDRLSFRLYENGNGYSRAAVVLEERLGKAIDGSDARYHYGGYDKLHIDELAVTITRNKKQLIQNLVLSSTPCVDNTARHITAGGSENW